MLTPDGITVEDRRARVRELADVTMNFISDANLDKKILNADDMALAMLQQTDSEVDRNTCTVSNLLCSSLIRTGIGDPENTQTANTQKELAMKIIESVNNKAPEQGKKTFITTSFGDYLE